MSGEVKGTLKRIGVHFFLFTMEYTKAERKTCNNNYPSPIINGYSLWPILFFFSSVPATHYHSVDCSTVNPTHHISSTLVL